MGFTKTLNLIFCYQKSRKLEKCILRKRLFCFSTVKWQKIELSTFGPSYIYISSNGSGSLCWLLFLLYLYNRHLLCLIALPILVSCAVITIDVWKENKASIQIITIWSLVYYPTSVSEINKVILIGSKISCSAFCKICL